MSITIIIIAITCIVSFIAFSNEKLIDDLIFYPPAITYKKQWYRFITCGFIHADIAHLAFNMYSFYSLGSLLETSKFRSIVSVEDIYKSNSVTMYLLLYISSLVVCLLPTYSANKNNSNYRSLGASGAISAVVFAFIFLNPTAGLSLIIIPIPAPAFIFGFVYLGVTYYLAKRGNSYINHSAHLWGAIYGIGFVIITCALFTHKKPLADFMEQVTFKLNEYFGR